jgi:hypothetical protein
MELLIWPCEVFLFILASDILHAVKCYDMVLLFYVPSEVRRAEDSYVP